jgi:hypothetical protein
MNVRSMIDGRNDCQEEVSLALTLPRDRLRPYIPYMPHRVKCNETPLAKLES